MSAFAFAETCVFGKQLPGPFHCGLPKVGYEMQIFVNGLVLIVVVLMEAVSLYRKNKLLGSKSDLLKEK